jgi:hypothetical protein
VTTSQSTSEAHALERAREIAGDRPITLEILLCAARQFGLHQGATFVLFTGYAEAQGAF